MGTDFDFQLSGVMLTFGLIVGVFAICCESLPWMFIGAFAEIGGLAGIMYHDK